MITIYVTHDANYIMSKELFPPTGILKRNREEFEEMTEKNALIISEKAYNAFSMKDMQLDRKIVIISERLCEQYRRREDTYAELDEQTFIARGYQSATQLLNSFGYRDITLLGDSAILEEAVMRIQNVERLITVKVTRTMSGDLLFHNPLAGYFNAAYTKRWPKDADNPYEALFQVSTKRY